jgi:hypothetical protein
LAFTWASTGQLVLPADAGPDVTNATPVAAMTPAAPIAISRRTLMC